MNPIVAAFKYDQYMLPGEPLKRHKQVLKKIPRYDQMELTFKVNN